MDSNKLLKCQTKTFREDRGTCYSSVSPTASVVNELTEVRSVFLYSCRDSGREVGGVRVQGEEGRELTPPTLRVSHTLTSTYLVLLCRVFYNLYTSRIFHQTRPYLLCHKRLNLYYSMCGDNVPVSIVLCLPYRDGMLIVIDVSF